MRSLALLVAIIGVATNIGAQTPLTLDTNFHFYLTPAILDYWEAIYPTGTYSPAVADVVARNNGTIMVTGPQLDRVNEIPWGSDRSVIMNSDDGETTEFLPSCGAKLVEIGATNQYYWSNKRRNYDCSPDHTFGYPDFHIHNYGADIAFPDRSKLRTGYFRITEADPNRYVLVKIDQWGEWDSTYTARAASGPDVFGKAIFQLSNGQILLNGNWSNYEGRSVNSVIRVDSDGVLDTTFNFLSPYSNLAAIHEQQDGKMILAGQFLLYDHWPDTFNLLRVNVDGSLDESFNNLNQVTVRGENFSIARFAGINVLEPLDVQRFVIGGKFTHIGEEQRGCIACVDTSGNLLDCWANGGLVPGYFSPSGWPYFNLSGFERLPERGIYIYGKYQGFIDANGLHPEQCMISKMLDMDVSVVEDAFSPSILVVWPNPGENHLFVKCPTQVQYATLSVRDPLGRSIIIQPIRQTTADVDVTGLAPGSYIVEVRNGGGSIWSTKWMKQ